MNMLSPKNGIFGSSVMGAEPYWQLYTGGNVFYVSSALGSNNNAGTFTRPFATLQKAIDSTTANQGDMVVLMANHAETITGVAGLAFNKAGITVVGIGNGLQKPRFLMDGATDVTAAVTGADTHINNVEFAAGHAAVVQCFDVQATGFNLRNCVFKDNTTSENFLNIVLSGTTVDNVADDITLVGNIWTSNETGALSFWEHTGHVSRASVIGNFVNTAGTGATAAFIFSTSGDDLYDTVIADNTYNCATTGDNMFIENDQADNTGMIVRNRIAALDADAAVPLDADGMGYFENYYTGDIAASGLLLPTADS